MNAHDTSNLMFLMNLSKSQLKQWYMDVSEDDRLYAEELLAQAHIMAIDARVAQMQQFKEAKEVLDKFTV